LDEGKVEKERKRKKRGGIFGGLTEINESKNERNVSYIENIVFLIKH
jgi:hypothetical protein